MCKDESGAGGTGATEGEVMTENTNTETCECIASEIEAMLAMAELGDPFAEAWIADGGAEAARNRRCDC